MATSWSAPSRIDALLGRLPRWARLLLSLAAVGLGVVLVTRPTTSLGVLAVLLGLGLAVLGVLTVAGEVRSTRGGTTRVATGVVMVAAGLFLLVFLGLTVRLAALVVGVALVVHGAGQALDAPSAAAAPATSVRRRSCSGSRASSSACWRSCGPTSRCW